MKLKELSANFSEFRSLKFRDGLNIVVADRDKEATKTDSRNGLGKTTALALIDFCLGAKMSERLNQMKGRGWVFALTLTTGSGITLVAHRSPDESGRVRIEGDVLSAKLAGPDEAVNADGVYVRVRRWTEWLQEECFGSAGAPANAPSFRSLMRHFARYRTDSFIDPFRTLKNQRAVDLQVENAYLLNLDWRLAREWAELDERKRRISLLDDGKHTPDVQIAALEPHLIRLQGRRDDLQQQISTFSILPEYRYIEARVRQVTSRIKALMNENLINRQQLALYESEAKDEYTSSNISAQRLFEEARIVLGDAVVRHLDEVVKFQRQVASNRRAYLASEVQRIRNRINHREVELSRLAREQEQDLELLRSGGALDDFAALQKQLAQVQVEVARAEEQIEMLREIGDRKSALKSDEHDLMSRTALDLKERFDRRTRIIARFSDIMELLYEEPADLQVGSGKKGFQFKTVLPKTGSGGVHLMAIFAYDVALCEDLAMHGRGPGFLLHDSAVFADVDERQTAKAIEIAQESAASFNYQHLIAINSDHIPWGEFTDRKIFDDAVVLRLNDSEPEGGILGQRLIGPRDAA